MTQHVPILTPEQALSRVETRAPKVLKLKGWWRETTEPPQSGRGQDPSAGCVSKGHPVSCWGSFHTGTPCARHSPTRLFLLFSHHIISRASFREGFGCVSEGQRHLFPERLEHKVPPTSTGRGLFRKKSATNGMKNHIRDTTILKKPNEKDSLPVNSKRPKYLVLANI